MPFRAGVKEDILALIFIVGSRLHIKGWRPKGVGSHCTHVPGLGLIDLRIIGACLRSRLLSVETPASPMALVVNQYSFSFFRADDPRQKKRPWTRVIAISNSACFWRVSVWLSAHLSDPSQPRGALRGLLNDCRAGKGLFSSACTAHVALYPARILSECLLKPPLDLVAHVSKRGALIVM